MAATDEWFTHATTAAPVSSKGIQLNGRKLGIRWDANSRTFPPANYPANYPANGYQITVWGSIDGRTRNRIVELLAIGPQEVNDRGRGFEPFFFYQGSLSGLTVPFPYAIVEFTNKTGEDLGSNAISVWVADAEPLDVKVPVMGFWGTLVSHGAPGDVLPGDPADSGSRVEQVRDYARVIRFLDVTAWIDQPGTLEFYEQSWNCMRLVSAHPLEAKQQAVVRFQRGGFPRFSLLIRNDDDSRDVRATCEIVAVARHE